ncbi:protoporphyrinogen oxidase HemJ [Salinarimonas sp.]|uniref:protoporphyrinogen oxidase HemJ n=1 Tax=Salinarimonas sp. TaxID=2766526 RepID=UPI0035B5269D
MTTLFDGYLWLKSLHVIAIIAWMAGLLYLPRLFVYHTSAEAGSQQSETFKVMERRLLKAITTPAMIVSVATGLWLGFLGGWWSQGWLHFKLLLVLGLLISHHLMARYVKAFAGDANAKSSTYYRAFNEAPTLLMIGIVVLVIVKPIFW